MNSTLGWMAAALLHLLLEFQLPFSLYFCVFSHDSYSNYGKTYLHNVYYHRQRLGA